MNLGEVARFGAVGLAQNGLNVAVFAALVTAGAAYIVAAAAAFSAALLASYVLNHQWTFAGGGTPHREQLWRYTAVFLAASAGGVVILALLVELADWPAVPAQVAAIVVVAPLSYVGQRTFGFRMHERGAGADKRS